MSLAVTVVGIVGWLIIGYWLLSHLWSFFRQRQELQLQDRWVVVTGCDSGIGAGVMNQLTADGASVIAFCFTEQGAAAALAAGAKLAPRLDITDSEAVAKACNEVNALCGGRLWGLAHIAGFAQPGFIEFQSMDNFRKTMEVNFFAIADITQRLLNSVKACSGRVVIVTSVDGIVSLPGNAPYDASKFAAEAYADALRAELSFWQVQVAVINPSTLRTPLAMEFFEAATVTWEDMERRDPDGEWKQSWPREWLQHYVRKNKKGLESIAQDPQCAVDDICHALAAVRPKIRYLSGTAAKTVFYALWVMPEHWSLAAKKATISPAPNTDRIAAVK